MFMIPVHIDNADSSRVKMNTSSRHDRGSLPALVCTQIFLSEIQQPHQSGTNAIHMQIHPARALLLPATHLHIPSLVPTQEMSRLHPSTPSCPICMASAGIHLRAPWTVAFCPSCTARETTACHPPTRSSTDYVLLMARHQCGPCKRS